MALPPYLLNIRTITIATKSFLEDALTDRLLLVADPIKNVLLEKYKDEFEALLEKAANRLIRELASTLVIEDKGSYLSVTIKDTKE